MVLWRRKRPRGIIMHTDRGSQYCSHQYQRMLRKHGFICSMSGKGNRHPSRQSVREAVFEYIETFYNTTRLHSSLGYLSPSQFEMAVVA